MKVFKSFIAVSALSAVMCGGALASGSGVEPGEALQILEDGNNRYIAGAMNHGNQDSTRRGEVAGGQHPASIIVSCSDSRVPPEVVFDQGLGDVFVIRAAGHVVDNAGLASIEYAVEHLGVKLIVVMGHQKCGAVNAAVNGVTGRGHLHSLTSAIMPAVQNVKNMSGDLLDNAIHENTHLVAQQLAITSPIIAEKVKAGELEIREGYYSLDTGHVDFVE